MTETTSEPSPSSLTVLSTVALLSASVIFWPSGALKTMRPVAPSALAPGKRCSRRSKAFCASVPGMGGGGSGGGGAGRADAREGQQGDPYQGDEMPSPEGEPAEFVQERGHEGVSRSGRGLFWAGVISPVGGRADRPDDLSGGVRLGGPWGRSGGGRAEGGEDHCVDVRKKEALRRRLLVEQCAGGERSDHHVHHELGRRAVRTDLGPGRSPGPAHARNSAISGSMRWA
ncbi:hypothetical protein SALBM311S_04732 [Streptomyces alboniger]